MIHFCTIAHLLHTLASPLALVTITELTGLVGSSGGSRWDDGAVETGLGDNYTVLVSASSHMAPVCGIRTVDLEMVLAKTQQAQQDIRLPLQWASLCCRRHNGRGSSGWPCLQISEAVYGSATTPHDKDLGRVINESSARKGTAQQLLLQTKQLDAI